MGLLDHITAHRKERKAAKEPEDIQDQSDNKEHSKPVSSSLSQKIKDFRTPKKNPSESQPISKTEKPSSTLLQNAGPSIDVPKQPTPGQGRITVQKKHRAPPKNVTRPEDISSDGDSICSDSSSNSSKKRSTESKAARKRQREMINFQKHTPNDLLNNQSSLVTTMPWIYPDTKNCDNRSSVHSSDSDKTTKATPAGDGEANGTSTKDRIKEAESLNPGFDGVYKGPESPTVGKTPEPTSHHEPPSYHTPHKTDFVNDTKDSPDNSYSYNDTSVGGTGGGYSSYSSGHGSYSHSSGHGGYSGDSGFSGDGGFSGGGSSSWD
ncbi:hypothetical protein TWF718_005718 [Orbilia javanica]|uniref:Uncharacterized protein n=1 Tax=Orbilia javanica TaxID=47235 RepID=A0AAN8MQC1_9PEZI